MYCTLQCLPDHAECAVCIDKNNQSDSKLLTWVVCALLQDAAILQDMCGDAWMQKSSLTQWRSLGEGAFATVQQCMLKQEAGALVQPLCSSPGCIVLYCADLASP